MVDEEGLGWEGEFGGGFHIALSGFQRRGVSFGSLAGSRLCSVSGVALLAAEGGRMTGGRLVVLKLMPFSGRDDTRGDSCAREDQGCFGTSTGRSESAVRGVGMILLTHWWREECREISPQNASRVRGRGRMTGHKGINIARHPCMKPKTYD